jgi:hypothetical protein
MERIKLLNQIYQNNPSFDNWKMLLIAVTKNELTASGVHRDFKINDAEAKKCFDSGMSPLQTFRETFEM